MWCDKVAAYIVKASYFIGKFLGLFAIEYDFKRKRFRTSFVATVTSSVICVLVAVLSPIVVKLNSDIYFVSGAPIDDNMSLLTAVQLSFGYATSFVVLLCQLWKRQHVSRTANGIKKIFNLLTNETSRGGIVTPKIIGLVAVKFSITMYEVLINLPYLIDFGDEIAPEGFVAFFLNLYMAEIAAVFSDITFAALLLLARYFCMVNELLVSLEMDVQTGGLSEADTDECRRKRIRLIRLYLRMRRVVAEFAKCAEISILVQTLNTFANMLSNLYSLLHFFAAEGFFEIKDLIYNVMIFVNICLLVYAAERVKQKSAKLKDTLLDLDACRERTGSGWSSDVLVFKVWPEVHEVDILGLFPLNNTFLLFLISYSSNFIVIILQFMLTKLL